MRSPVQLFPQDTRVVAPSFHVTRTWRPGGFRLPAHTHEHTNIALCLSGSYEESLAGKWQRVTRASLICRPGGVPHANRYSAGGSRSVIFEAPSATVEGLADYSRVLEQPFYMESTTVAGFAARVEEQLAARDDVSPLALEGLAYELIAYATRRQSSEERHYPAWLDRALEFIAAEFRRPLSMGEIAAVAGVHPSHLARIFRQHCGTTVGAHVRQLRVAHGASRLREAHATLADISAESGFCDQSHFTRAFTRQMGVSPARYRRLLRT